MSEIITVLLLVAIVVSMGLIVYAFASGGLGGLSGSFGGVISNQGNAAAQNFALEQAAFTYPGASSSSSPILDGTSTTQVAGSSSSIAATLTTARANDVVVAYVSPADTGATAPPSVSGISGGGLTWTHRVSTPTVTTTGDAYVPITITNNAGAPALDGSNYNAQGTPTATIAATLTTTSANDVIIAIVSGQNSATGTYQTPSISDAAPLVWHARSTLQEVSIAGGYSFFTEEFYAIAYTALSGDSITVTWNSAPTHYAVLQVFGVSGANTGSPFDPNTGVPNFTTGAYASATTSNADDFIFGLELTATTGSPTAGTGFTGIESGVGGSFASEYKVVTATQSGLSMTYSNAASDSDGAWGDAVVGVGTATPATFQQMVTWDPATYTAYEATNLGNVRFCDDASCITQLYAWLESCSGTCSTGGSTSTSASAWVQLDTAIAGSGGTLTIFMVFEPTSTNFDGVYWGEAPQLSGTYAQYDNGANVFTSYWNFAGTTCPTGWTCSGTTISNGISAPSAASAAFTNIGYGLTANELDFYGTFPLATSTNNAGFGYNRDTPNGNTVEWTINDNTGGNGCGSTSACLQTAVNGPTYYYLTSFTTTGTHIYSLYWGSTASATACYSYTNCGTSTSGIPTVAIPLGIYNAQGTQATIGPFNWLRLRAYPPTGVMPSTSLGALAFSSLSYLPVTFTNSQTAATPATFQQEVSWNPSTYAAYEATSLGNIRFCADALCATPLYAWLESCSGTCSTGGSSSTSATAWVKLTSAISANGGTLTIYMVFEPSGAAFDGVRWGEAPSLSAIYAQYDNGANVFETYADFSGTTLPAGFSTVVNGGTESVSNGLTLSAGSTQYIHFYTTAAHTPGVLELDLNSLTANGEVEASYDTAAPGAGGDLGYSTAYRGGDAIWDNNEYITKDVGGAGTLLGFATASSPSGIVGLEWPSTGTQNLYVNYAKVVSATDSGIAYGASYLDVFLYGNAATQSATASWLRNRADPPSGVMPSTSFGTMVSSGALYVPLTISNSQTSATPNPFQQMVTFDPASFSAYEATNLGNVRFCADALCATPLYAWLESCSSTCSTGGSSSTSATAWVKLTSTIAANGGTLTIYMVFDPTTTTFDGVYWGEAPQISSTYAQYDNGANVFLAYANGNTAISSFTVASGYTLAQATGVAFGSSTIDAIKSTGSGTFGSIAWALNTAIPKQGLVVEGITQHINGANDVASLGLTDSATSSSNAIGQYSYYAASYFAQEYSTGGTKTPDLNQQGAGTTSWVYSTVTYPGSSSTTFSGYIAPQFYSSAGGYAGTVTANPFGSSANLYLSDPFGNQASTPNDYYLNLIRARAYPPSGVMPTASVGSADSTGVTLDTEEWYAVAASTVSSATITATLSTPDTAATWIAVFGVSGSNTASPFDPCSGCAGGAAPQTASGVSNVQTTMSTSNPNDLLLYGSGAGGGGLAGGFSSVYSNAFSPDQNEYVGYESVSLAQTSLVTSCGGAYTYGAEITDAVAGSSVTAYSGASLYVRNVGTVPVTLVSVYIVDQSTNTFVGEVAISQTLSVGAVVDIPQTTLTFTPYHGHTYSFKVTSSLGSSVTLVEKAV